MDTGVLAFDPGLPGQRVRDFGGSSTLIVEEAVGADVPLLHLRPLARRGVARVCALVRGRRLQRRDELGRHEGRRRHAGVGARPGGQRGVDLGGDVGDGRRAGLGVPVDAPVCV